MAVGKNKRISKGKKGGSKKKVGDTFLKKEWYDLKAPSMFSVRNFGKTLVTKSQGTRLAADGLRHRVFEVNLADLTKEEEHGFRKIKLSCEDIQERNCLTDFHGMDMTRNHLCFLIRKWQSLIEAHADVRTTDDYLIRLFVIGFTKRQRNQVKSNCYIQSSKARLIRKRMVETLVSECAKTSLRELVQRKFPHMAIEKEITRATGTIFPLQNVHIRKVKVLKKPKFDVAKLSELHGDYTEDAGRAVVAEAAEAQNLLTAAVQ